MIQIADEDRIAGQVDELRLFAQVFVRHFSLGDVLKRPLHRRDFPRGGAHGLADGPDPDALTGRVDDLEFPVKRPALAGAGAEVLRYDWAEFRGVESQAFVDRGLLAGRPAVDGADLVGPETPH